MPGCTVVVILLAACACRAVFPFVAGHLCGSTVPCRSAPAEECQFPVRERHGERSLQTEVMPRPVAVAVVGMLVSAGAVGVVAGQVGPWRRYPYWKEYLKSQVRGESQATEHQKPGRAEARAADAEAGERRIVAELEEVVPAGSPNTPGHTWRWPHPTCGLEAIQLQTDDPMSLASLREAAARSHFGGRARAMDASWSRSGDGRGPPRPVAAGLATCPAIVGLRRCEQALCRAGRIVLAAAPEGTPERPIWTRRCGCALRRRRALRRGHGRLAGRRRARLAGVPPPGIPRRAVLRGDDGPQSLEPGPAEAVPAMLAFIVREFQPDFAILGRMHDEAMKRVGPEPLAAYRRYYAGAMAVHAESLQDEAASQAWLELKGCTAG